MESHSSADVVRAGASDDGFPSVLRTIDRREFLAVVAKAENDAADAIRVRDDMRLWAARLEPFFENESAITVAEALRRYRRSVCS